MVTNLEIDKVLRSCRIRHWFSSVLAYTLHNPSSEAHISTDGPGACAPVTSLRSSCLRQLIGDNKAKDLRLHFPDRDVSTARNRLNLYEVLVWEVPESLFQVLWEAGGSLTSVRRRFVSEPPEI